MRLKVTKSKNAASLYVIKSVYNSKTKSNSSKIVEKLGTEDELRKKLNGQDPYQWAKDYIAKLNQTEKAQMRKVIVPFSQSRVIPKNQRRSFNGGYLFLQKLYHNLGLPEICKQISEKYKFEFNLDSILSRLLYGRILSPASKLSTFQYSQNLLEQPDFHVHQIYRALEVISKETDFIQAQLYKNSLSHSNRNDRILYYDCTNYFFEIEEADGLRQYGPSKQHQPSPLVEMGLFMDGDGIPLAFNIHSGNTNEQGTMKPLERKLLKDFELSQFVVCTDAGLSSKDNRHYNTMGGRSFLTTQSIKKLKDFLKTWALEPQGWTLLGSSDSDIVYNLTQLELTEEIQKTHQGHVFYKERWINENGLEQRLIVTYSLKYRDYHRRIRESQKERALNLIETTPESIEKKRSTDYKRLIKSLNVTEDGEIAQKKLYSLDTLIIEEEARYDGFYGICTNLEDDAAQITKINHRRWEIEETFRLLKTDFKARPVYLSRDDRIIAHFTTCFLAITLYRYLEKALEERFTSSQILSTLREMNFYEIPQEGYIPTYTRSDVTDSLHEVFDFRTDYEIVSKAMMKKFFRDTKR